MTEFKNLKDLSFFYLLCNESGQESILVGSMEKSQYLDTTVIFLTEKFKGFYQNKIKVNKKNRRKISRDILFYSSLGLEEKGNKDAIIINKKPDFIFNDLFPSIPDENVIRDLINLKEDSFKKVLVT